jgi:hypothetical protein
MSGIALVNRMSIFNRLKKRLDIIIFIVVLYLLILLLMFDVGLL